MDTASAPAPTAGGASFTDSLDLGLVFKASTAVTVNSTDKDMILSQRAHERYLETLDRVFLSDYTQESTTFEKAAMQGNVASHVPYPQPWVINGSQPQVKTA